MVKYIDADLVSTCLLIYTCNVSSQSYGLFHLASWLWTCSLLDEELSLNEFEYFVNKSMDSLASISEKGGPCDLHDWSTDEENRLPLIPVQWKDREQTLQEWDVKQGEVQSHRQRDGIHKHHVLP